MAENNKKESSFNYATTGLGILGGGTGGYILNNLLGNQSLSSKITSIALGALAGGGIGAYLGRNNDNEETVTNRGKTEAQIIAENKQKKDKEYSELGRRALKDGGRIAADTTSGIVAGKAVAATVKHSQTKNLAPEGFNNLEYGSRLDTGKIKNATGTSESSAINYNTKVIDPFNAYLDNLKVICKNNPDVLNTLKALENRIKGVAAKDTAVMPLTADDILNELNKANMQAGGKLTSTLQFKGNKFAKLGEDISSRVTGTSDKLRTQLTSKQNIARRSASIATGLATAYGVDRLLDYLFNGHKWSWNPTNNWY